MAALSHHHPHPNGTTIVTDRKGRIIDHIPAPQPPKAKAPKKRKARAAAPKPIIGEELRL